MTCWRRTTGRLLPSDSRLFFTGAPWPSVGAPVHWWEHWCTFFSKGTLCGRLEPLFFNRFHSFFIPFVFHNSGIRPPPFFSLLLTTMPHGRRSVTTSLDCVETPAVAVLCENDWPSSACVVQLERKKKKRVSVIVGNRKVVKKASNHHQLPSNHHKVPSNHHKVPSNRVGPHVGEPICDMDVWPLPVILV
jgi:hypothetical protein